jgi:transposase-like protein
MPKQKPTWNPAEPPDVTFWLWSQRSEDKVCDFRWWGPTEQWDVVGEVERGASGLQVRSLRVVPHGGDVDDLDDRDEAHALDAGITPKLLRDIPLGRLLTQVHAQLLEHVREGPPKDWARPELPQWMRHTQSLDETRGATGRRPGRPRLDDALLRELAVAYIEDDGGRGVHARLAQRFGREQSTIRDWIRAARDRKYLAEAAHGQRSAAPGERLLEEIYQDVTGDEGVWPTARPRRAGAAE